MPSCPSCGAERLPGVADAPCSQCGARGARAAPELELDVRPKAPPRPVPRKVEEVEMKLELAVEPRSFSGAGGPASSKALAHASLVSPGVHAPVYAHEPRTALAEVSPGVGEVAFDARLLAEYGDAPRHWLLSPLYAWRVLTRQRVLRKVLLGRREEAARAAHEVEDALVAFAERSRAVAEKHPDYARSIEELRGAEDVLRSRDRVLASEQDAQSARLASVDARLDKLEAEVAHAQAEERAIAAELASAQAALARGESKLKRAESELRSAQQREASETHE
jgi:hypothetical protein